MPEEGEKVCTWINYSNSTERLVRVRCFISFTTVPSHLFLRLRRYSAKANILWEVWTIR